ncbi:response regulator [bacterium]|nr:response regulator [bacterium]
MANDKKILIIDDEPNFLLALQMTLEAKGYQVISASDKKEAQKKIRTSNADLVVLGTMTPYGDAFTFHKLLKQDPITKDIPLLVVDAPLTKRLIDGWSMDEGMQMDAEDYVTKPIEPAELLPRIQALLKRTAKRIKVLIVDDHAVVRDGLRAVLKLQKDIEVVGEAVNGQDAAEKTLQLLPDVVLMDIVMPVMNGLEATKKISKECPQTRVLMLTQYDDEENILTAEQVGAYGFIPKRAATSQLITGIRTIYGGQHFKG